MDLPGAGGAGVPIVTVRYLPTFSFQFILPYPCRYPPWVARYRGVRYGTYLPSSVLCDSLSDSEVPALPYLRYLGVGSYDTVPRYLFRTDFGTVLNGT